MCAALAGIKTASKKAKFESKKLVANARIKSQHHTPDERGGAYAKRFKSGAGAEEYGEGGSSSTGRVKRLARFTCIDDLCKLLDEYPISVMARHCGIYFESGFIMLSFKTLTACRRCAGHPGCIRSEKRIAELIEADRLQSSFEEEKLKHPKSGKKKERE